MLWVEVDGFQAEIPSEGRTLAMTFASVTGEIYSLNHILPNRNHNFILFTVVVHGSLKPGIINFTRDIGFFDHLVIDEHGLRIDDANVHFTRRRQKRWTFSPFSR